jgi:hypothetical protein
MTEFKSEFTLNAIGVRPATVEEAQELLFASYHAVLLQEWAEQDKLLITEDGDLFISDAAGFNRAQQALDSGYVWEDLMEILNENGMQSEKYMVQTAVALLAAGWRPSE